MRGVSVPRRPLQSINWISCRCQVLGSVIHLYMSEHTMAVGWFVFNWFVLFWFDMIYIQANSGEDISLSGLEIVRLQNRLSAKMCSLKLLKTLENGEKTWKTIHKLSSNIVLQQARDMREGQCALNLLNLNFTVPTRSGFRHQTLGEHDLCLIECNHDCVKVGITFCEVLNRFLDRICPSFAS